VARAAATALEHLVAFAPVPEDIARLAEEKLVQTPAFAVLPELFVCHGAVSEMGAGFVADSVHLHFLFSQIYKGIAYQPFNDH
jgi:hypothetical protein